MSSHHIVKDAQEPALIIANGQQCSLQLLEQLLEWSPTVMVLDGALERVLTLGIKIDVVLGDFDRLNPDNYLSTQDKVKIVHTPDQSATDLEKGIRYFIGEGYKAVNIVWATGLRMDHTVANITNLVRFMDQIDLVMWDDYSRIFPLKKRYEKWYPQGTPLSLIPIGECKGIVTSGLKYNLEDESLMIGERIGNSNEAMTDGMVTITYKEGKMLLMECRD